jgi:hypothetical protein
MTNIDKLVAIEEQHGVSLDFLGHLIWFTITDCRITRDDLENIFGVTGLDKKFLPKPINQRDAFRRATSSGEVKRTPYGDDMFLNIMVRDVRQDSKTIERQLLREIVDSKNTKLEHRPVCRMMFNETDFHVIPMEDMIREERDACDRIEMAYEMRKENYDGRTCRDIINDVLRECRPVAMRSSGGVYFVPKEFEETIEALQAFCERVSAYSITRYKSKLYRVPVVNADEQLEMLEESVEEQVKKSSESMIAEMTKILLEGKKVTQNLAGQYVDKAKSLRKMVESYREMLQSEITGVEADLEVVLAQAMAMMDRVEVGID